MQCCSCINACEILPNMTLWMIEWYFLPFFKQKVMGIKFKEKVFAEHNKRKKSGREGVKNLGFSPLIFLFSFWVLMKVSNSIWINSNYNYMSIATCTHSTPNRMVFFFFFVKLDEIERTEINVILWLKTSCLNRCLQCVFYLFRQLLINIAVLKFLITQNQVWFKFKWCYLCTANESFLLRMKTKLICVIMLMQA